MTISDTEEFKHSTSVIFGEGSANEQYCSQANVNNHRKLKARLKSSVESGTDLEYTDPKTSATVKLSDDDIFEINAIPSFKAFMQSNETGPKKTCPLDITELSHNDFTRYLTDDYDKDNPDKYDINLACMSINFYIGGSISVYQDRAHAHVLNVLLDAAVNNETTLALEENGVASLPAFWTIPYMYTGADFWIKVEG